MNKSKITLVVGVILIVAVFALAGASWTSATATAYARLDCVDAYAGGPDFLFNARPDNIKIAHGRNCLSVDYGPTFLVNSHAVTSGPLDFTAECPQVQTGAPTFLVNARPTVIFSVAAMEGKCTPG
jgi:hypothetical protein